jgi:imidazolonepropionase-like amidohydrolase
MKKLLAAMVLAGALQYAFAADSETIAIVGAKAYITPGADPTLNATIIIRGGRVEAAGSGLPIPAGAQVIHAEGKIVTPGLMNSGTELGLVESGSDDTTDRAISSGPIGAAFDVQYALNPNSTLFPLARADGLTRAVTLPSASAGAPFTGLGAVLRLSEGAEILDRPRAAMFAVTGGMAASQVGGSRSAQWVLLRNALDEALRYMKSGQTEKAEPGHNQLLTRMNLEALVPVIQGKVPLAISALRESDIRQAIKLADDYKLRVIICGADEAWRVADLLAMHKIPVVLNPFSDIPATFDQIGARADNAALLARAGVIISFSVPGVHYSHNAGLVAREAAGIAVANGLTWNQALKAVTVNPAETWGISDHYGTLEPGRDADLVIWSGDPFEPMSAPEVVLVRGKRVSLHTRQIELEERYSPQHANDPWPPAYR